MSCIKHIKKRAKKKVDYTFSKEEAEIIAKELKIDFENERFDLEEFYMGINVELEHGLRDKRTNVTLSYFLMKYIYSRLVAIFFMDKKL